MEGESGKRTGSNETQFMGEEAGTGLVQTVNFFLFFSYFLFFSFCHFFYYPFLRS